MLRVDENLNIMACQWKLKIIRNRIQSHATPKPTDVMDYWLHTSADSDDSERVLCGKRHSRDGSETPIIDHLVMSSFMSGTERPRTLS